MTNLRSALLTFAFVLAPVLAAGADAHLFAECNSHINKLIQDHDGYIWMATDNGLTRFDGSSSKTFTRSVESPSLLNNIVLSVMEDSNHDIWVGTFDGVQRFDRSTETFVTPRLNYPGVPEFTYVNSIIEDSKGNIWFTTSRSGVISFQGPERKPVCFLTTNSSICSDKTTVVFEDKFGNIWIGTNDAGITVYNPSNNTMTHHSHDDSDPATLSGNMIFSIAQVNDGRLLIASLDGGIDSYDYRTHRFTRGVVPVKGHAYVLRNDHDRNVLYVGTDGNGIMEYDLAADHLRAIEPSVAEFDISRSKVHDIVRTADGNLWAAVYQKGALRIPPLSGYTAAAVNYGFNPFRPERSIGTEPVLSIMRGADNDLWIGTDGDGIYRGTVTSANTPPEFVRVPIGNSVSGSVLSLFRDSRGVIYAGSYLEGLAAFDSRAGRFIPVQLKDEKGNPIGIRQVNTIAEDASGRLWIGTNGNGVCITDPSSGVARLLRHDPGAEPASVICGNAVHTICFDHNGDAWIGTSDAGLSRLRQSDGHFEHFNLANRRLPNNCVYDIHEDETGRVWVATAAGLACIAPDGTSRFFNEANGLPGTSVYSILADSHNNLWLSLLGGEGTLARFDTKKLTYTVIPAERLRCREFKRGAAFADGRGKLWFGGVGGVVGIDPEVILTQRTKAPALRFTELAYRDDGDSRTTVMPLYGRNSAEFDYKRNNLTFKFGAIEYTHADEIEYAVMLKGFHDTWQVLPHGVTSYTLTDIPPGDYSMAVRAIIPGAEASVCEFGVSIKPPFWQSTWARVAYAVIVLILLTCAVMRYRTIQRRRTRERLKAHEDSLTEAKLQFFTDISHEIRTPLSLILGPISALKKKAADKATLRTYEMMESNGDRILRMIAQVIDLRKLDNERMGLDTAPTDLRTFLGSIIASFEIVARERAIDFSISVSDDVPEHVWLDTDKIDKVLFNVIANALRFTPHGGRVAVEADIEGTGRLRIRVSDSGEGIPEDVRELIFERFYQVKGKQRRGGTGIGLHLSRKLMQVHHGSIFVEQSSPEGTTFAIIVPVTADAYTDSEKSESNAIEAPREHIRIATPASHPAPVQTAVKAHTVLIIEDDTSILDYLGSQLASDYNIVTAADGEQGLEAALRQRPHCIITDIMMPGIDGLELCRKIRANHDICDIPVVMLTARAADAQRLEGIEAGADSYITKPFNIDHLRTQVAMLIHSRRVMKQKFSGSEPVNEDVVSLKSGDEKLLERVEAVVLESLDNSNLSVEFIASRIGVSRSHLHRRLKVLTNMSPSTYIKQARMRHAALLLTEKKLTISEVAYATGFTSLSHFSTVFKEYFGMSPSRYVAINANQLQEEKS